jgi:predicted MPP superfamily phosphohydrolase
VNRSPKPAPGIPSNESSLEQELDAGDTDKAAPASPAEGRSAWTRTTRILLRVVFPALVGLIGASLAMPTIGRDTVTMGPFRVQLSGRFGLGITDISLPPLGKLSADTHRAPLRFTATLQSVNVNRLADEVSHRGLEPVLDEVQSEALDQVAPFAARLFLVAIGGALVLSLVVFRTRWDAVLIGLAAAFLAVGGCEAVAWRTYRPSALVSPTFSGPLAIAPRLIGPAQTAVDRIDDFRAELSRVLGGAVRVYTSFQANPVGSNEIRVLHISDIHLSPLGMSFAKDVAEAFDVDFVLDTGDLTSFGTPAEDLILSTVSDFRRPYVFVRGNHDSTALQEAMARIPNALVLDGRAKKVGGLVVYGLGDPLFTPNKLSLLDDRQIADLVRSVGPRILADAKALPAPPDIVAVHDDRMADAAAGSVPLVVSGHFHVPAVRVVDGTLFLRDGSTGGAGANVFTEQGGIPLQAEILYFERGTPPRLVAYDLIDQSPESASLTVKRHLIEREFGTLFPTPPSATPAPSVSPSG